MDNNTVINSDNNDNASVTKSVTRVLVNTHCVVCGTAFQAARVGKLYCSARCKQFGYNHKSEIGKLIGKEKLAINPTPIIFYLSDYIRYNDTVRLLKRFKDLKKKMEGWELVNQEIGLKQHYGLIIPDYLWQQLSSKKLTENEEAEFDEAEADLDAELSNLVLKQLSLEQWSFLKILHPTLEDLSFFRLAASISSEFMQQLSFSVNTKNINREWLVIQNKFINHCNLIATGIIKFEKNDKN